jgi:hypothetical protein
VKKASRQASMPMPVPTKPPPGRAVANDGVNELMPFLEFVERHPVGTSVNAVVDSYSSHGAYVRIGDVKGYVPLRMMGDPPPRSAREVIKVGDAVTLVVASFAPARRSIDLSMPQVPMDGGGSAGDAAVEAVVDAVTAPPVTGGRGRGRTADAVPMPKATEAPARKRAAKSTGADRRAATTPPPEGEPTMPAAEHTQDQTPAKRAPRTKAASKRAPAKHVAVNESPETAPAVKTEPAARTEPAATAEPAAKSEPTAKRAPVTKRAPAAKKAAGATKAPAAKKGAATKAPEKAAAKTAATKPSAKAAAKPVAAKQPAAQRRRASTPERA